MAHIARTSIALVFVAITAAAVGLAYAGDLDADADAARSAAGLDASTPRPIAMVAADIEHRADTEPQFDQVSVAAHPLNEEQQELVDWARGRFTQAGLELPELIVRFDPTRELCGHDGGRYQHAPSGERIVTICARAGDSFAADLERRRTLLHEFGHAWDFAHLSDADRDELGHTLGVESWNDHDAAWEDRGVERFAETFVYALLDQPRRQLKVGLDCTDLVDAFGTATGAEPQGPGVPYCVS